MGTDIKNVDLSAKMVRLNNPVDKVVGTFAEAEAEAGRLPVCDCGEWLSVDIPEPDALIPGLLEMGNKADISGGSKLRKSFLALMLAICLATGKAFLNFPSTGKKRRVLYINFEITPWYFQKRVKWQTGSMSIEQAELKDFLFSSNCRGYPIDMEKIGELVRRIKPDITILDPFYKVVEGDESKPESLKPILLAMDALIKETGCSILKVLHHSKGFASDKTTLDRSSGSGILGRDCDVTICVSPHAEGQNLAILEVVNRNFAPRDAETIFFDTSTGIFHSDTRRPIHKTRNNGKLDTPDGICDARLKDILKEPIAKTAFIQKLNKEGLSQVKAKAYFDELLDNGTISEWHRPEHKNLKKIGFPADIERLKMEAKST